jgi:hypothetical protein
VKFSGEWDRSHGHRVAPTVRELKVRRLRVDDEWWLVEQVEGARSTKAKLWLRALAELKRRESRAA